VAADPVTPAWYPSTHGRLRFWDGSAWTDHYAPTPMGPDPRAAQARGTRFQVLGIIAVAVMVCSVLVALVWGMSGLEGAADSVPVVTVTQSVP
jgi:hypothetical protein